MRRGPGPARPALGDLRAARLERAVARRRRPGARGAGGAVLQRRDHRPQGPAVTARTPVRTVLFDLDGTLSDSAAGIVASLRHAFAHNGIEPLGEVAAHALVGPPLHQSLPPIVGAARYDAVFAAFKAHQDAGARIRTSLFPGVADMLDALVASGLTLAVATSKHDAGALQVVGHLGIADRFATVCGEQPGGPRDSKAKVVAEVMRRLDVDPEQTVLVGDRAQDAAGARANGIGFLGAGWGYAVPPELDGETVCATPADVTARLGAERAAAR
ncbi:MAG: HAD family hydrolase [Jatrophihabitans sp.]|nr:MAG: HAD family hydrolase [Jatrophihabitans sp.]